MITRERLNELALEVAHRQCTLYEHVPITLGVRYCFSDHHIKQFAAALLKRVEQECEVVGEIHKAHCRDKSGEEHWCKEILMYSPNNPHDIPEYRNKIIALPLVGGEE